ncbi:MAG: helix-turn-helix domain-containing protein [Ruminococcus flavefaciens]|nr:helix-turn-helix domain-containing protein [Eubacterium sp.]MCM1235809.1 helix-turn-helix domain-containing protein [Ruminococcus flavefaciens]
MNDSIIGRQISKFRKAAEMTQEELGEAVGISSQAVSRWECGGAPDIALLPAIADKLGVTVDALFGRDGSECADIEDVVGGWLCSVPKKERLDRLCRLVWSSVKYLLEDGLGIPEMGYLETCHPDMGDGLNRLMLSQIRTADGILLDIHAEDLSFVTLWPEPKEGYAAWLAPKEEYRRLFGILSRQGCLELLEYLHCRKRSYFVAEAAAKQLGMSCETVEGLLNALEGLQILRFMELELDSGEVKAYELAEPAAFVPFLYIARCFMQTGMNYICVGNYDTPLLQKGKWRDKYDSLNAVQTKTNYIYFGNYDNSCARDGISGAKGRAAEEKKHAEDGAGE